MDRRADGMFTTASIKRDRVKFGVALGRLNPAFFVDARSRPRTGLPNRLAAEHLVTRTRVERPSATPNFTRSRLIDAGREHPVGAADPIRGRRFRVDVNLVPGDEIRGPRRSRDDGARNVVDDVAQPAAASRTVTSPIPGVGMTSGANAVHRISWCQSSSASDLVRLATPASSPSRREVRPPRRCASIE